MIDIVKNSLDKHDIKQMIISKLNFEIGVSQKNAEKKDIFKAVLLTIRDILEEKHNYFTYLCRKSNVKDINYLSMEFLIGPSLKNNLYNLDLHEAIEEAIKELGFDLEELFSLESDPGLGNGGLGRLAACFMDSMASLNYPATGYSLLYEYGIFKQMIVNGWQVELPDEWLSGADSWIAPANEQTCEVKFDGEIKEIWKDGKLRFIHENYKSVLAVPYDMFISGKGSYGVSLLRLWKAKSKETFNMESFMKGDYAGAMEQQSMAEVISKVLYPPDNHPEGKSLRLRQQYFLVSASVQNIIRRHLAKFHSLDSLYKHSVIHINDTHPALVIPELMRVLIDEYDYDWDRAWDIVKSTVHYTNHTVLSEALEIWPEDIFKRLLPRVYQIVIEINERFCREAFEKTGGDFNAVSDMAPVAYNHVRMANLSVIGSKKINGVSKLHSKIIKDTIFKNYSRIMPERFENVTNGIAHRRWLCQANPKLTEKIIELIGDSFIKKPDDLEQLLKYQNDMGCLDDIGKIKKENKKKLSDFIKKQLDIDVDEESIFDVQVKRIHEYKRQQMNAVHILYLYRKMKSDRNFRDGFVPRTFIFGGKAAPGYEMAKQIVKFICNLADVVNNDKEIDGKLKIVYVPDYNVSTAEIIIPAADVSQQISQAGKEASGTGNMKFMINGALTLGTYDGANIEICEAVGEENIYIFGLRDEEIHELIQKGYDSCEYIEKDVELKETLDSLENGKDGVKSEAVALSFMSGKDRFMSAADFGDYNKKFMKTMKEYRNSNLWNKKCLINVSKAGFFSADRSIRDYGENIWYGEPLIK